MSDPKDPRVKPDRCCDDCTFRKEFGTVLAGLAETLEKLPRMVPINGAPALIEVPARRIDDLARTIRGLVYSL
jgi:hypothetical protein